MLIPTHRVDTALMTSCSLPAVLEAGSPILEALQQVSTRATAKQSPSTSYAAAHHAYSVACALVSAAQIRSISPQDQSICDVSSFSVLWPEAFDLLAAWYGPSPGYDVLSRCW